MKVSELIEKLSKLDQDKNVLVQSLGDLDLEVGIESIRYYVSPKHPELGPYEFEEWMSESEQVVWLFDEGVVPPVVDAYLIY